MPEQYSGSVRTDQPITDDLPLIAKARDGNMEAFGELVRRHERSVYAVISRIISSRDEVDDLAQEVFVSAWKSLRNFRGDARFSTWLHSIAVNAALKRLKKLKRVEALSIDDPEVGWDERLAGDAEDNPAEIFADKYEKAAVRKALSTLSDNHRAVVTLYYFEECPCEEIARIMGCSIGTVWSRLHYACKKLRSELDQQRKTDRWEAVRGNGQIL